MCVDLDNCDVSAGKMDMYACHGADASKHPCPGGTRKPPNQLFGFNRASGTISYNGSSVYCLGSTPIGASGTSQVRLQKCTGAANQLWQLGRGGGHIQQRSGASCVSV